MIEQIRQMVEARYGQISSSVAERADEDTFDAYENAYAVDTPASYEHDDSAKYDEAGAEGAGFEREESLEDY